MTKKKLDFLSGESVINCGKLLNFGCDNSRYSKEVKNTIGAKGVYIIISDKQRYIYPKKDSKVIYIGKAVNLFSRIERHRKRLEWNISKNDSELKYIWDNDRYLYMRNHGANVYYIKAKTNKPAMKLESEIMLEFYRKYQATPIGNGARSLKVVAQ
ncbi:GIY-YIG nuclease family protein [Fusobacteria bacterium ZRK30]|nr:GIY-YIG nuclease family protein [Fusobacteria bacterium ZRK30]